MVWWKQSEKWQWRNIIIIIRIDMELFGWQGRYKKNMEEKVPSQELLKLEMFLLQEVRFQMVRMR